MDRETRKQENQKTIEQGNPAQGGSASGGKESRDQQENKKAQAEEKQRNRVTEEQREDARGGCCQETHHGSPIGAILLISLGIVFFLNNFNILPWSFWGVLWKLWPLFLVLIGLQLILGRSALAKWIVAIVGLSAVGIVLCLSLVTANTQLHNYMRNQFPWWSERLFTTSSASLQHKEFTVAKEDYPEVKSRELQVNIGVSEFNLNDDDESNYLQVKADYDDDFGVPQLSTSFNEGKLNLDFSTASKGFFLGFMFNPDKTDYDLRLGSPEIPTDVEIDLGTGKGTVNFDELNLNSLTAEVGTGSLEISLDKYALPSGKMLLKAGTGAIVITLPKDTGLKITQEVGIGSVEVNQKKIEGNTYISSDYENASAKVELDIEVGTGSVEIVTKR